MNNAKSFIRFTDFGLRTFAVDSYTGNNSAKTNRIFDFEKQEGNAIIQFPFGTESDGGTGLNSKFAVDQDYDQQGVFNLGAWIEKEALNANERKIINQFRAVINYLTSSASIGDIDTFAQSVEPDAPYSFAYNQFGSTHFEIYATPDNFNLNRTFSLCLSAQSSTWLAQWFISDLGDTGIAGFYTLYPTKTLPLEADIDGFLFQAKFYDFDYLVFPDTNIQTTAMPIHSFDVLKFNIIPEEANMIGVDSCTIGLMDEEGNVVDANVGEAVYPGCLTVPIDIPLTESEVLNLLDSPDDVLLLLYDCDAVLLETITIPFAELDQSTPTTYAQSIADYVNALGDLIVYFTVTSGAIDFDFTFVSLSNQTKTITFSVGVFNVSGTNDRCANATQLQATVTIPGNLLPGCYKFYLYQQYPLLIYSFSNGFELNDFEDFTQIISFSGTGTSQGFEYLDDWFQQFRFPLNGGNQNSITSDSEYRDSRGNFRRPTSKSDLSLDLHTSWIDIPTLEALFAATQHSNFVLGSKAIYVQGEIEANHPQDFTTDSSYFGLAQAKFKALIQNYQPLNRGCTNC
jgi:hypothetical protein